MADPGRRVFLSYASSDSRFASRLAEALSASGVDARLDTEAVEPGGNLEESILSVLRESDIVVFVVPEREGAGKWALAELGAARALGKRIVAVVPEASRYHNSDVARILSGSAVIDASSLPKEALVNAIMTPLAAASDHLH
ncbi:MAG: toll/interleukin-1 receptor domain-containing protein [Propylenella sp.]